MIDWYTQYDEINAELRELVAASVNASPVESVRLIYIGSGEDFCEEICHMESQETALRF